MGFEPDCCANGVDPVLETFTRGEEIARFAGVGLGRDDEVGTWDSAEGLTFELFISIDRSTRS